MNIKEIYDGAKERIDDKGNCVINLSNGEFEVINVIKEDFKLHVYTTRRLKKDYSYLEDILKDMYGNITEERLRVVSVS